jgi:hypothetical protein
MTLAGKLRSKVPLPRSPQFTPADVAKAVQGLRLHGYVILPMRLSPGEVDEIAGFAFSTPAIGKDLGKQIAISRDCIPEGEARYVWFMDQLAAVPAVRHLITQGPYCAIAQDYLGCRPILTHINLWLDRPFEGKYEPYSYHYDNDGPAFLKFFFFLTEVDIGTGAHYFVAGTQGHRKPARFAKSGLYREEDVHSHFGRDREIIVRGPAGTILVEDTSGFHRGSTIDHNYRLLMQLEFNVIDVPTDQELHREIEKVPVDDLHPGIESIARKFYTRCAR